MFPRYILHLSLSSEASPHQALSALSKAAVAESWSLERLLSSKPTQAKLDQQRSLLWHSPSLLQTQGRGGQGRAEAQSQEASASQG